MNASEEQSNLLTRASLAPDPTSIQLQLSRPDVTRKQRHTQSPPAACELVKPACIAASTAVDLFPSLTSFPLFLPRCAAFIFPFSHRRTTFSNPEAFKFAFWRSGKSVRRRKAVPYPLSPHSLT
eukprot:757435-Hanusia_phi.AAC.2